MFQVLTENLINAVPVTWTYLNIILVGSVEFP